MSPVHQHQHFGEKIEAVFTSIDSSVTTKDVESMSILPSTPCLISSGKCDKIPCLVFCKN
ncbi:unnamed protein product [Larinioides sclopetarius]|uniref:Uncharacterized protein n=1 Tax=Larinioides sclopetarius TaxID=280406 RepID=A0AAV2BV94_9ARAC